MFQFPESLSAEEFLRQYWQKSHLFMPQALPAALPELSADELGWLATLDDVESRLVFSKQKDGATHYRVEHGPFDEKRLASLPTEDWTLLVQDVEKHLPEFRKLTDEASFIPDWRIDDLMVSFAASGGSVGPHRDNYDVFLCQGTGRREWRIAHADADLPNVESAGLSLVAPFTDDKPIEAGKGDVLYLPPGIPHWGIAREPGLTYSIGMRAPTLSEFMAAMSRVLDTDAEPAEFENRFYVDPDLTEAEAQPGLISERAIQRARGCFSNAKNLSDGEFAVVFGSMVTEVKAWLRPEEAGSAEIDEILAQPSPKIRAHGMARLAYCTIAGQDFVFVNGNARPVSQDQMNCFRRYCSDRMANANDDDFIRWLLAHGAVDLPSEGRNDAT